MRLFVCLSALRHPYMSSKITQVRMFRYYAAFDTGRFSFSKFILDRKFKVRTIHHVRSARPFMGPCYSCGKFGHYWKACPTGLPGPSSNQHLVSLKSIPVIPPHPSLDPTLDFACFAFHNRSELARLRRLFLLVAGFAVDYLIQRTGCMIIWLCLNLLLTYWKMVMKFHLWMCLRVVNWRTMRVP